MMSAFEIVQMYKEAADKNAQIEILADLNACGKDDILLVLQNEGLISGVKTKQKKNPSTANAPLSSSKGGRKTSKEVEPRVRWTEEMKERVRGLLQEGLTVLEVSERMGLGFNQVRNAVARFKLQENAKCKVQNAESNNGKAKVSSLPEREERIEPLGIVSPIRDYAKCITSLPSRDIRNYEKIVRTFAESIMAGADSILKEGEKYGA